MPGEFQETLWLNCLGGPRYHPDIVTLAGAASALRQMEAIAGCARSPRETEWTVKDSFRCLDLGGHGFEPMFDAEWIGMKSSLADLRRSPEDLQWMRVGSETELVGWERRWAATASDAGKSRLFPSSLLSNPDVGFVFVVANGAPIGGGIVNRGADVVGISNVFAPSIDTQGVWTGLARAAAAMFPGLMLVAYDRGHELAAALRAGFTPLGALRIWRRPHNAQF